MCNLSCSPERSSGVRFSMIHRSRNRQGSVSNIFFTAGRFPCNFRSFLSPDMKTLYNLLSKLLWKIGSSIEAKGSFPIGCCIVTYSLTERSNNIEVYNPVKDTYLDNIAEWLMMNIPERCFDTSEWNDNGFRDEADYLNYRYG